MVPVDVYKKLTLEAIDAYQQKHYHSGLANIRAKFLPNDEQETNKFWADENIIDQNALAGVPKVNLTKTLFDRPYDRSLTLIGRLNII